MKKIILFTLLVCAGKSFGQEKADTIGLSNPINMSIFEDIKPRFATGIHPQFRQELDFARFSLPALEIPSLRTVNLPQFNYSPTLNILPTDNLSMYFGINNRSWINTAHISSNFMGLGGITLSSATYNRRIGDMMVLSGGIYAAKYNFYNNFYNSTGLNGNLKLYINDRISINMHGQYSVTDNKRPIPFSSMYPQSFYGGSFEFKVTEKWGIITGADREFDVMQRKWVTRPYILPVFYGK